MVSAPYALRSFSPDPDHLPSPRPSLLQSLIGFWGRNSVLILGLGVFVCFWMLVYTFFVFKPSYAAKSIVIIKDSAITSRYVEPDQYYALQTTSSSSSNPVLNTMGILKSAAISKALWQYLRTQHPEQLQKLKIKTQQDWTAFYQDGSAFIKAKNQPGTDLISVQFTWSDPKLAKEGLSVVLQAFQDASRDLNRSEQSTRTQFLEGQVKELEAQLLTVRKQKSLYQVNNQTVSVRRESEDLAGSRMELSNRLNQVESWARGKERLVHNYQQLLGMNPEKALNASALGQNGTVIRLQDELYRLQQQYAQLSASLTDSNPKVREIQAQIEQVKANLAAEQTRTLGKTKAIPTVVADGTRGELVQKMLIASGEAQDLRAQAATIRQRLGQINTDISAFPQKAEGLAQIEQKEASLSLALDHLRQKALEGRVKEAQTLSNVFIVDAPLLPQKPQVPTRTHLILLSIVMGLGVGICTAFAKEQLTTTQAYRLPEWMEPLPESDTVGTDQSDKTDNNISNSFFSPMTTPSARTSTEANPSSENPSEQMTWSLAHPLVSEPASEKMDLPQGSSLFDTLIPVAGPMAHQSQNSPPIRRDLTQSLTSGTGAHFPLVQPNPLQETAGTLSLSDTPLAEWPVAGHLQDNTTTPKNNSAVRLANVPSAQQAAEIRSAHQQKTTPPLADQEGVPVMHASEVSPSHAPEITVSAMPPAEASTTNLARPIHHEPIRFKAPAEITVQAEAPSTSETLSASTPSAALYDEQARQMPLPRRKRGVPSFLLNAGEPAAEDSWNQQPYTLIPKKQLLQPEDNLLEDVAPLSAPDRQTQANEQPPFPQPLLTDTASASTPADPSRGGPFNPLWMGKKPHRHPEAYFGLGGRKKKRVEVSTSLDRLMTALREQAKPPHA